MRSLQFHLTKRKSKEKSVEDTQAGDPEYYHRLALWNESQNKYKNALKYSHIPFFSTSATTFRE